jgi:hypothetical protein
VRGLLSRSALAASTREILDLQLAIKDVIALRNAAEELAREREAAAQIRAYEAAVYEAERQFGEAVAAATRIDALIQQLVTEYERCRSAAARWRGVPRLVKSRRDIEMLGAHNNEQFIGTMLQRRIANVLNQPQAAAADPQHLTSWLEGWTVRLIAQARSVGPTVNDSTDEDASAPPPMPPVRWVPMETQETENPDRDDTSDDIDDVTSDEDIDDDIDSEAIDADDTEVLDEQ